MNVENEINKHDPISIDDISCVHFDLDFEGVTTSMRKPNAILILSYPR